MSAGQDFLMFASLAFISIALALARTEIHDLHNSVNALSVTVSEMRR